MNLLFVAAEVTRRIPFDHDNLRLLTLAATVQGLECAKVASENSHPGPLQLGEGAMVDRVQHISS